jgi:exodeoxyribonuclease VII large subunit
MDTETPLTVTALTQRIKLELNDFGPLLVTGELSQIKVVGSGHLYATLKDEGAVLSLVMWRSSVARMGRIPAEGSRVTVRGSLDVYPPRGSYQIIASRITEAGQGDLAARLEALKGKLTAEGLFAEERKRPLPFLPRAVGLATASGSAALADLLHSIRDRFPDMPVVVAPCLVQGRGAAASIVAALDRLAAHPQVDVIICGRGGGSLEDLWAFNEEPVVRAIAGCSKPVVSAVGHETDWTLADLAADLRAKTPTAAGELIVPVRAELDAALADARLRLDNAIGGQLDEARARLAALAAHRALAAPGYQIQIRAQRLDELSARLHAGFARRVEIGQARLSEQAARLHALSPLAVIGRGFTVLRTGEGRLVRRLADAVPGTQLEARVSDGWIFAEAVGVKPQRLGEPDEPYSV